MRKKKKEPSSLLVVKASVKRQREEEEEKRWETTTQFPSPRKQRGKNAAGRVCGETRGRVPASRKSLFFKKKPCSVGKESSSGHLGVRARE